MHFIIPSYKRHDILINKTLKYLNDHEIKPSDIHIFVRVDDDQLQKYLSLRDEGYNVVVVVDVIGIGKTHNYITEYFDEGEFIVELDDDLDNIIDNHRQPIIDFKELCQTMKDKLIEEGCSYGGTYSVANPLFMSGCEQYTTDLRYMLGCVRWRFVRKDISVKTDYAEDMEHCILHYIRDDKILKNNWIAPITKNYNPGGCDGDGRNFDTEKLQKQYLEDTYPQYCRLFQRKNGRWDCRLKHYKANKK